MAHGSPGSTCSRSCTTGYVRNASAKRKRRGCSSTPHPPPRAQGYDITLFNRGKTANRALPGESKQAFDERIAKTTFVKGDRTNPEVGFGEKDLPLL